MIDRHAVRAALRPTDREIVALARAEATPGLAHRFEPICHGPIFAVIALGVVGLAAIPSLLWRLTRFGLGRRVRPDPG